MTEHRDAVLDYDDLAALFRRERATIGATIARWMRDEGFPPPLPGQKPRLWSAVLVIAWITIDARRRRERAAQAGTPLAANDDVNPIIAADRARLEARYLGGG